jgi:hypothetical protein
MLPASHNLCAHEVSDDRAHQQAHTSLQPLYHVPSSKWSLLIFTLSFVPAFPIVGRGHSH